MRGPPGRDDVDEVAQRRRGRGNSPPPRAEYVDAPRAVALTADGKRDSQEVQFSAAADSTVAVKLAQYRFHRAS